MSDSQFVKVFSGMILALAVLTVVLIAVANSIGGEHTMKVAQADYEKAVAERTRPVGQLSVAAAVDSLIPAAQAADGKATYDAACAACHGAGVAGAPKLGDKAAWKDRIAQGNSVMYEHAIKGFQGKSGFMPAKGGNASLSDDAVKAAVDYMMGQSK